MEHNNIQHVIIYHFKQHYNIVVKKNVTVAHSESVRKIKSNQKMHFN